MTKFLIENKNLPLMTVVSILAQMVVEEGKDKGVFVTCVEQDHWVTWTLKFPAAPEAYDDPELKGYDV